MQATIDSGGRILLPKALRDALGLVPGANVEISAHGSGLHIVAGGRCARIERGADGHLAAQSNTRVTDEMLLSLVDAGRR